MTDYPTPRHPEGRRIHTVTWTDPDGRKQSRTFFHKPNIRLDRQPAVLFLNYLILDCGLTGAKRRAGRTF